MAFDPGYIRAAEEGVLNERIAEIDAMASPCVLCPRRCSADRGGGERGFCQAPYEPYVSSAFPHRGEERELAGRHGSGTVFFAFCNLRCAFCQNWDISIGGEGDPCSYDRLATLMEGLQDRGCHNINLVTPTHYVPQILKALSRAIARGLKIPLVYNSGGYDSLEVIRLLDGIIDIYMPDIKFLDGALSDRYCRAPDYPEVAREVVREMQRQVGDLVVDDDGVARRGLLIRHLVMPSQEENTRAVLRFIREEISENAYVNVMAQYHPAYRACDFEELSSRPSLDEFSRALEYARRIGLPRAATH